MTLSPHVRIGPYEISGVIGAGGMGEVYRATDTVLNRAVALKVPPDAFAADAERVARFKREAQVLASLNHPHIAQIYGFETSGPVSALAMELVEGPTLADRIAHGAIPLNEALPIARQLAEALDAAHEQGIVHRDLKPANIKIKARGAPPPRAEDGRLEHRLSAADVTDGIVKVLDFGLAKALESVAASSARLSQSPTITSPAMTQAGIILGTAAYMSPEQARGRPVDKRSDIWSFGCVLFEMLTGRRAFDGEDVTDTIAAVVRAEPDWSALPPDTPAAIRRLLRRCIQKDTKERLPDIGSARLEIKDALTAPEVDSRAGPVGAAPAARPTTRLFGWIAAAALLLTTIALAAAMYLRRAPEDARTLRFSISPSDGWSLALSSIVGAASPAPLAVSPDGHRIAYVARSGEKQIIWVQALDELTPKMLTGTDGGAQPFWSPDSRYLAFVADGKLKKIDLSGGPPIALCDVPPNANAGAWTPDGVLIFSTGGLGSVIQKVSASGGMPVALTATGKEDNSHLRPSLLPDGRHFLFAGSRGALTAPIYVGSVDSRETTKVFDSGSSNVRYAQDHVLFLREQTLMAQSFDARRLTLTGEPVPIAEQVVGTAGPPPYALFSTSDNGVLVYQPGGSNAAPRLQWFDQTGKELSQLGDPALYSAVALSPDGRRAAVTMAAGSGARDIWVFDIARGFPTRLTFDSGDTGNVIWSPDGTRVAYSSSRSGRWDLYQRLANGAAGDEVLLADRVDKELSSWSPDGRWILYVVSSALSETKSNDIWVLPLSGDRKPFPFLQSKVSEISGQFSPDGRWVAYQSNESGRPEIYVVPFSGAPGSADSSEGGTGAKWQVSNGGGAAPRWRRDGKEIFYVAPAPQLRLMAVPVTASGSSFSVGASRPLFRAPLSDLTQFQIPSSPYDVTPDGQRVIGITRPEQSTARPMTVIVNWTAGLKK